MHERFHTIEQLFTSFVTRSVYEKALRSRKRASLLQVVAGG
jgi:hypothetical protein